jgi:hypothetical protein
MKYVLLFCGSDEDAAAFQAMTPYLEGKESIGGYAEIEVADLDEALRMAKTWPGRGTVEIRPVMTQP